MTDIPLEDLVWQAVIGAFALWLIVRIITRRERWAVHLGIACAILAALAAAMVIFFIVIQRD